MTVKICAVTGSRAEYGLLTPLLKAIQQDTAFELQLLVTGMHLSPEFGLTYKEIEKDGFFINEKIEILLSADTDTAIAKSTGLGMISFADAFERLQPHRVLILGDRFEAFAAASTAYLKKIPIFHLHGGETTQGATDEALRHAITKMSALHFTSTEAHRQRVLQLGEQESTVFNTGALGIDNILHLNLLSKNELEKQLGISFQKNVLLVTYHPVTLENSSSAEQFQNLLHALDKRPEQIVFTLPNADADGRVIAEMIKNYSEKNPDKALAFTSLGQLRYLSLMAQCYAVVGNSSSGIIETPSFHIPTVNIGDRQKGREAAASVIHCNTNTNDITAAFDKMADPAFREQCKTVKNPYGDGNATGKIISAIKANNNAINLKKIFADR